MNFTTKATVKTANTSARIESERFIAQTAQTLALLIKL